LFESVWQAIKRGDPSVAYGPRLWRQCGGHVAVHGRDKYLILLACGGVALGSQNEAHAASDC
jgi:hypothetical protein